LVLNLSLLVICAVDKKNLIFGLRKTGLSVVGFSVVEILNDAY
jgi:hypothetical protein